jgi:hypothetical protein
MATRRRTRSSTAVPASSGSILSILDEGALQQVLLATKDAQVLGLLASSSRQLCSFARSRVPVHLRVFTEDRARKVIRSHACGRPPFSGCTKLYVSAPSTVMCCLALGVLHAAQQWTGLQELELFTCSQLKGSDNSEYCAANLLSGVPSLRQLRQLVLDAPVLGVCGVVHLQQLVQLTCLHLTAPSTPADAAADLTALSRLTNLVALHLCWALAPHPPASPEGPYCLPSSLVTLGVYSKDHTSPAPLACWLAHLPGCPQLQHLHLTYGQQQHASAHPNAVVEQLVRHTPHLRSCDMSGPSNIAWDVVVAGLPAAAAPVSAHWQLDASLAALTGLQRLEGVNLLAIREQADWQHLAQATALTSLSGAVISRVPGMEAGSVLRLLELEDTCVELGAYDVGRLLLALPALTMACIEVAAPVVHAAGPRLLPHPTLKELHLGGCDRWGHPAAAAAEQFGVLAPSLSGVSVLTIAQWPHGSTRGAEVMPDLSPCTALTNLAFDSRARTDSGEQPPFEQESILSMVAPLQQLQRVEVRHAPRVNARIALALQSLLPQLQFVDLWGCGRLLPGPIAPVPHDSSDDWSEDEQEEGVSPDEGLMVQRVLRLLRAGLSVSLYDPLT